MAGGGAHAQSRAVHAHVPGRVVEHPDNFVFEFDDQTAANLGEVIGTQDAVVLGRRTYDDWAAYWPGSTDQPFAGFINNVAKYVVTSSSLKDTWTNVTVAADPVQLVEELKVRDGGDIGIHGSIKLSQALLAADVVDELRLVVTPVVIGAGRRLFEDDDHLRRLTLLEVTGTPSGTVLLRYSL
jgi:dihydrofolate reductase